MEDKLQKSFDETIKKTNLTKITTDLGEIGLDSILEDGVLKDIPILGTIVNIGKSSLNIKDRLFTKKIIYFLSEIENINSMDRNKIISKIDKSEKYNIKVGEKILYILDNCDDHEKAKYIGKFFKILIQKTIDYEEFLRFCSVIESVFLEDFKYFLKAEDKEFENELIAGENINDRERHLANVGLIYITNSPIRIEEEGDIDIEIRNVARGGNPIISHTKVGNDIKFFLNDNYKI